MIEPSEPAFGLRGTADAQSPLATEQDHWQVASMTDRGAAALVDVLVLFLLWLPTMLLVSLIEGVSGPWVAPGSPASMAPVAIPCLLVTVLYLGLLEGRVGAKNGQTLGKFAGGQRTVVARGGLPVGRGRTWLRAILLAPLYSGGIWLAWALEVVSGHDPSEAIQAGCAFAIQLAFVTAVMLRSRRTFYDWLLGTAVVHAAIVRPDGASDNDVAPTAPPDRYVTPLEVRGESVFPISAFIAIVWVGWGVSRLLDS